MCPSAPYEDSQQLVVLSRVSHPHEGCDFAGGRQWAVMSTDYKRSLWGLERGSGAYNSMLAQVRV